MANTWDRTFNPSGAISRTLQGGGSSYSGIPANPTGYPSQNYSDFGSAGMYAGTPGFASTFEGMGVNQADIYGDDSQIRSKTSTGPDLGAFVPGVSPTQGINSIQAWGGGSPNTSGVMWGDPTFSGIPGQAGTTWGAGLNAPVQQGDNVVWGTKPDGIQDWIDEGLIDPGAWKSEAQTSPIVEATPQGPEAEPSCPNGYTFDPALNACVMSTYSLELSGLDPDQKMNLLSNPKMMELYMQNKNAMTSGEFVARPEPGLLPPEGGIRGDR